jgi:hypothetical protein
MATIVCGLPAALLKSDELIAQVDKGHGVTLAAQFEPEETAIECQWPKADILLTSPKIPLLGVKRTSRGFQMSIDHPEALYRAWPRA